MEIATMIRSAAVFRNSNAALSTESNVFVFITPERDYILENCRCTNLNKVFEKFWLSIKKFYPTAPQKLITKNKKKELKK